MQRPYLLPRERPAVAVTSLRHPTHTQLLKLSDPATRAMTDFQEDSPLTVAEDLTVDYVFDEMFRLGVRAFLVVCEGVVTGLITAEHARGEHNLKRSPNPPGDAPAQLRVAGVMTPAADVPAVDWQMIEGAQIRDLIEIFEATGAHHLVVLENEMPNLSRVRGLINRARLERQLGARWSTAQ
jgi:CBS domain-containing protein